MFGKKSKHIKASNIKAGRDLTSRKGTLDSLDEALSTRRADAPTSNNILGFGERAELVENLLAIPSIADRARRATVIEQLHPEIKTNIDHNSVDKIHLFNIVKTCLQYANGIEELREILQFFEGDSIPMQQFKEAISRLSLSDIQQPKSSKPPISLPDPLSILAAMPVKEDAPLPEVTTLPAGSRMPFKRYAHFVGRKDKLRQLAAILKAERGGAAIGQLVAATGLGGIGKTQLAIEFAHRYGHYFAGGVFWLDFSTRGGINNEVARCGGAEGMRLQEDFDNLPLPERLSLVRQTWGESLPRLLIFDNCENEQLVDQWRPSTGGCRVLITSRRGYWAPARAIQQVALDTLTPAESQRLLGRLAPHLITEEKAAIAQALGHFPLALHLAGSFLHRYQQIVTVATYLKELEQTRLHHPSLVGRGSAYSPTQHEQHIARTFAISWQRLHENEPIDNLAQQLLLHAAHFAPDVPIPLSLLQLTLPEAQRLTLSPYDYADAQHRLVELGLLEKEQTGLTIHRLVAAFAHMQPQNDDARQQVEQALLHEARRLNNAGYPAPLQAWQTHLRHLTDAARKREDEIAAALCNTIGYHLNAIGEYRESISYMKHAIAINTKILGLEHMNTASSINNLGFILQTLGEYESARPYLERALAIFKKVLGLEHPHTATSLNNLGVLWDSMGEYESARPYYERALAIRKKVFGLEHPESAASLNNLGYLWHAMGEYENARPYLEYALAIRKKVLGLEHAHTATSLNNLGELMRVMGEYESARPYYKCALAITEKVLGLEHPDTAGSLNNLGALWNSMGEYEKARPYYERALAINEKVLGLEHPDTALCLNNLGLLFQAMGQYESVRPYLERALAIRKKMLGLEHPDTAQSLNSLGFLFYVMGQYESARPYFERAQAIFEKRLGANHPSTQTVRRNLELLEQG